MAKNTSTLARKQVKEELLQVRMSETMMRWLREVAVAEETTVSALARQWILAGLRDRPRPEWWPEVPAGHPTKVDEE